MWKLEDGHVEVVARSGLALNWIDDEFGLKESNYRVTLGYYIALGYILKFFISFCNM
jgi:hypothetical protein